MTADFFLYSAAAVWLLMTSVFAAALAKKDNSIVDMAWGGGFIMIAGLTFFLQPGFTSRQLLVTLLVTLWGLRLLVHIAFRNRGRGEDFRYAKWRKEWGRWFIARSYFQIYMLQGIFMLVIAYPIIFTNASNREGIGVLQGLGTVIWLTGFFFEAVGDAQLTRFKRDQANKGKIMTRGLWTYSRHPNYFGEVMMWWGIFVITLPEGWTTMVSPILITFLLLRVSGVTMLEKKYKGRSDFEDYARRTSAFFPLPPKKT